MRTASNDSNGSVESHTSLAHLPPLPPTIYTNQHAYKGKTSEPTALQSSIGFSLSKLLTLPTFTAFLSTQTGYTGKQNLPS